MSETKPRTTGNTDVQKLQRAIVDGLEDVKGQDIVVFDTEHLSPLFERVIIASGTSNRQTKALASSVADAVREAGFPKPRVEGEGNGEWIVVDCGAAVAHVMQPNIRQYYHLEEIWGGKTVHLKSAAATRKAAASAEATPAAAKKAASKTTAATVTAAKTPATKTAAGKTVATKTVAAKTTSKISSKAPGKPATKAAAGVAVKPAAKTTAAKATGAVAAPVKIQKLIVGKPAAKPAAKRATGGGKAPVARKTPARKSAS